MNEWHANKIEEIQSALDTSSQNGITVREARKRLEDENKQSGGRFSLFVKKKKHPIKTFFSPLLSPLMLMLVVTSLLSAIFGVFLPALCVLFISLSASAVVGAFLISSQKKLDELNEYSSPMVKAIRGGKLYHTDGRNAVRGDIVNFSKGDIIVADIRLTSSDNLTVKELYNTKQGVRNRVVQKDSSVIYCQGETRAPDAANMVYAGSAVIGGEGSGIVVDTAKDVYLAKYAQEGSLDVQKTESDEIKKLSDIFRRAYVVAILVVCILSMVSLLTLRETPFVANFLLILSSFFSVSIEIVNLIYQRHAAKVTTMLYNSCSAEFDYSAAVRGSHTLEELSEVSDVVLLGDAAFSSGSLQVREVYAAGDRFATLSPSNMLDSRILGCIDSYIRAQRDSGIADEISQEGVTDSLLGFLRASEFDFGASLLTTVSLFYLPDKPGKTGHACVETNKGEYRVTLTFDSEILSHCSCVRTPDGMDREMYRFFADGIEEFISKDRDNTKFVYVVTEYAGEAVLEAIVALSQVPSNEIIPSLETLKNNGIKTWVMSFEEKSIESFPNEFFDALSDKKIAYASKFKSEGKEITDSFGEYCAYLGFSPDEFAALIAKIKSHGARVATYGVNDDYYDVMAESDVAVSCDVINYSSDKYRESVYERILPDGRETSLRTSQRMRLLSNIIVKRTNKRGGGLSSVANAIASAKDSTPNIAISVLFLASILALVLPFTLMSVITGVPLVNAPNIALLIFYSVLLVFLVFPNCKLRSRSSVLKNKNESTVILTLKNHIAELISFSSISVTVSLLVVILELFGVFGETRGYAFALHAGLLASVGIETSFFIKKYFAKIFGKTKITVVILLGLLFLLSVVVAVLAIVDGNSFGYIGTFEFLLSPIVLMLYFISKLVSRIILNVKNKAKK